MWVLRARTCVSVRVSVRECARARVCVGAGVHARARAWKGLDRMLFKGLNGGAAGVGWFIDVFVCC